MDRAGISPSNGSSTWNMEAVPVSGGVGAMVMTTASQLRTTANHTASNRKESVRILIL